MSNNRKPKAKPSLFEQARAAKPRTESYHIPLVDHDEAERIWGELSTAKQKAKQDAIFGPGADMADVERLQAEFDASFRKVTFRGLPPKDQDALANEYPDPPDLANPPEGHVPFIYRLAVACAVEDYGVTAEQWHELCDEAWPAAEGNAFRRAVLDANSQAYSAGLGKEL